MRNNFSLPDTWGFGLNYQWRDRLMLEAEVYTERDVEIVFLN